MKKTILSLAFLGVLASCQDKTKEKIDDATEAVTEDVKTIIDSAKLKAEAKMDTLKEKANAKVDSIKVKAVDKMEESAKKLKESIKK